MGRPGVRGRRSAGRRRARPHPGGALVPERRHGPGRVPPARHLAAPAVGGGSGPDLGRHRRARVPSRAQPVVRHVPGVRPVRAHELRADGGGRERPPGGHRRCPRHGPSSRRDAVGAAGRPARGGVGAVERTDVLHRAVEPVAGTVPVPRVRVRRLGRRRRTRAVTPARGRHRQPRGAVPHRLSRDGPRTPRGRHVLGARRGLASRRCRSVGGRALGGHRHRGGRRHVAAAVGRPVHPRPPAT